MAGLTAAQQQSLSLAQTSAMGASVPSSTVDAANVNVPQAPDAAAAIAAKLTEARKNELVNRGMVLPFGVTRGGDMVPAVPQALKVVQDSLHSAIGTAIKIMNGEVTDPSQLSPQELLNLGALSTAASLTSFRVGGAAAGKVVSDVTQAGKNLGIDVPRGAVGTGVVTRSASKVTNAVPIGGAPLRAASKTALQQLEDTANAAKNSLGASSMYEAGQKIETGITSFAGRDKSSVLSQRVSDAYDKVDALVDPNITGDLTNTTALVGQMQARAQASGTTVGKAAQTVMEAATRPGGLTYQGIKDLRTKVGEWVSDKPLAAAAGVSQGEAKAVYSALTQDMQNIVQKAGGQPALDAWTAANAEAQNAADVRTALQKVLRTGNEGEGQLFNRLVGMAGTGSAADVNTLGLARDAVGNQNWGEVLSAMVEKWGFNEQGQFNPTQFATQWAKVTPEAKAVLFKTPAEQAQAKAFDDIAKVAGVADRLKAVAAPPPALITGALGLSGAAALTHALSPQNFGFVAGTVIGSRVVSNILAKPEGAAAFASWAKAYTAFAAKPGSSTMGDLTAAARSLAYQVSVDQGLDPKSQVYLRNYLMGAPVGHPLAVPQQQPPAVATGTELKA